MKSENQDNHEKHDSPNVVALPPLIYLSAFIIGLLLNYFFPFPITPPLLVTIVIGLILIAAAGFVTSAAFRGIRRVDSNIDPRQPTTAIVTDGVFAFSRNPIYLGLTLLYTGAAVLLNSIWILLLLIPVLFVMQVGVIFREEEYLAGKFGAEYAAYKSRVRRWI